MGELSRRSSRELCGWDMPSWLCGAGSSTGGYAAAGGHWSTVVVCATVTLLGIAWGVTSE